MKKIFCLFLLGGGTLAAQNSVNSNGQSISYSNYIFDQTLGEPASVTLASSTAVYTQGFNQPSYYATAVKSEIADATIVIYPNPTSDILQVKGSQVSWNIKVLDTKGAELMRSNGNNIDLKLLPTGEYVVQITSMATQKTNQYKIIKK